MSHDPILHAIGVRIHRTVLFCALALLLGLGLWAWVLVAWYDVSAGDLWSTTVAAVSTDDRHSTSVLLLRGCGLVGALFTAVLYLLVALWWRRSGDVHRRGTRFIDAREGRQ